MSYEQKYTPLVDTTTSAAPALSKSAAVSGFFKKYSVHLALVGVIVIILCVFIFGQGFGFFTIPFMGKKDETLTKYRDIIAKAIEDALKRVADAKAKASNTTTATTTTTTPFVQRFRR